MWMAVLNPWESLAVSEFRKFLGSVYGGTALNLGFPRWGQKETRWTSRTLQLIEKMWPRAQIVFLTREFGASWRSRFPSGTGYVPQHLSREMDILIHCEAWMEQAEVILKYEGGLSFVQVKYESLLDRPAVMGNLLSFLNLGPIDPTQNRRQISRSKQKDVFLAPEDVPIFDRFRSRITGLNRSLGYPTLTI